MPDVINKKKIQLKSFNYKWYEFLIIYGIFNILFFLNINASVNNIYKNFSELHVSNFIIDGSDLSIFVNLFAVPLIILLIMISFGFVLLQELIAVLLLRFMYFISMVKDGERARLYRYIKIVLLCFILANIVGVMFWGDILRTTLLAFMYLPLPFFTFIFVCLKIKKLQGIKGF